MCRCNKAIAGSPNKIYLLYEGPYSCTYMRIFHCPSMLAGPVLPHGIAEPSTASARIL